MKILKAKFILTCTENFEILENKAVVFDRFIREICDFEVAVKKYANAEILDFSNDFIMPAFLNLHTHLEFSANRTDLYYGEFLKWVASIVAKRQNLTQNAVAELIASAIKTMQKSGVGTIGEISSFGNEAEICAGSGSRVIFFNEILGANENLAKQSWQNFLNRFENSLKFQNELFIPAISVHSPYSTCEILAKKAVKLAKERNLLISTHFLESKEEFNWLNKGTGGFKAWLKNFNENPKPFYTIESFAQLFKGVRTLFTHCVWVKDFSVFDKNLHSITHCAVSNRLLSQKTLNLKAVRKAGIALNIATDGLSSNVSLNFLDELRANLFIHEGKNLCEFAKFLLLASTNFAAKSAGLNLGQISKGKIADFAVFKGFEICEKSQLALQIILQSKEVKNLIIKGKICKF